MFGKAKRAPPPEKCKKLRNPCKICFGTVTAKSGLQCEGACKKWVHFKCLSYTPGKIQDIKKGYIQVKCPCPDCDTHGEKEKQVIGAPYFCGKSSCPASAKPVCQTPVCPKNNPIAGSSKHSCPEDCSSSTGIKRCLKLCGKRTGERVESSRRCCSPVKGRFQEGCHHRRGCKPGRLRPSVKEILPDLDVNLPSECRFLEQKKTLKLRTHDGDQDVVRKSSGVIADQRKKCVKENLAEKNNYEERGKTKDCNLPKISSLEKILPDQKRSPVMLSKGAGKRCKQNLKCKCNHNQTPQKILVDKNSPLQQCAVECLPFTTASLLKNILISKHVQFPSVHECASKTACSEFSQNMPSFVNSECRKLYKSISIETIAHIQSHRLIESEASSELKTIKLCKSDSFLMKSDSESQNIIFNAIDNIYGTVDHVQNQLQDLMGKVLKVFKYIL